MDPIIIVPLPVGKLGIKFTGSTEVIVSQVKEDGAMNGRPIKPGYIVKSLILGDGSEYKPNSKEELVAALGNQSHDPNRKLKLQMAFKNQVGVTLPASKSLGFEIEDRNGKPTIVSIQSFCSIKDQINVGMVVDKVSMPNDYDMEGYNAEAINGLLNSTSTITGRKMVLKALDAIVAPTSENVDFDSKTLELPSGRALGLRLGGSVATIQDIEENSPLSGVIFPGMIIASVRIPNGTQYNNLSGVLLHKVFIETMYIEGRLIHLIDSPEGMTSEEPTLQIFPPILGASMEELGISLSSNGTELIVDKVETYSDLSNVMPKGAGLVSVSWRVDGTNRVNTLSPQTPEQFDDLLLQSSGCDRFFMMHGLENIYMPDECTIPLPKGKLGVVFKGASPAMIVRMKNDSPLLDSPVVPGMAVSSLVIDGVVYNQPTTQLLTEKLAESPNSSYRRVTFVNPRKL
mmetsp:Transcript_19417/g.22197  ORF Transcript_19417/g.22197 Transcript_19417/m.22197 type:complete len:458 (-) Transcript_19417:174-1547(-)|eukprot:CAMPEP_0194145318 /NCGR_PEP_ID=MMETSP0152-20130528/16698_1 /TAXON_ID=1049557 /ORGANISM="Thalassiothrix antarctica, Strain L6-D1" /LENGTH=457 /DNA_ID=CAMNT_0038845495 /DNA_START=40 /DNA_END=1413 /DNA_ORIENTATION=+